MNERARRCGKHRNTPGHQRAALAGVARSNKGVSTLRSESEGDRRQLVNRKQSRPQTRAYSLCSAPSGSMAARSATIGAHMNSPTGAVTRTAAHMAQRITPEALWAKYVSERWTNEVQAVSPRNGLPKLYGNPKAWMALTFWFGGYSDGEYTIKVADEYMTAWAQVKLTGLGNELTLMARRYGIDKPISVRFETERRHE